QRAEAIGTSRLAVVEHQAVERELEPSPARLQIGGRLSVTDRLAGQRVQSAREMEAPRLRHLDLGGDDEIAIAEKVSVAAGESCGRIAVEEAAGGFERIAIGQPRF